MRILIAPSGLKESVEPLEAVRKIASGVRKVYPNAEIDGIPVVDGGEGTTKTLVELTHGELIETTVTGPVGQKVKSFIGILGGPGPKTAVVEMAAAGGLRLVPRDQRNPQLTTTYGVGELIKLALDQEGVERILCGCGDSGTNDAGIGMAQALGAKFLDHEGNEIGFGAINIPKLARIDTSSLHPKLKSVKIDAALNAKNILCGPKSVARVYGPQKGATPEQVEEMASSLDHFAAIVKRDVGKDVALMNGGGASGGLGAGLFAFLGANLHARFDVIMDYLGLESALEKADLILTAEGAIDFQTPQGKVPALLAERASERGIPVIVLAGMIGKGAEDNYGTGITAFESIQIKPVDLAYAIRNGGSLLESAAERTMRFVRAGTMVYSGSLRQVSVEDSIPDLGETEEESAVGEETDDESAFGEEETELSGSSFAMPRMTHLVEALFCCGWLFMAMFQSHCEQVVWAPVLKDCLVALFVASRVGASLWQSTGGPLPMSSLQQKKQLKGFSSFSTAEVSSVSSDETW